MQDGPTIRLRRSLWPDHREYLVWGYCGLRKNRTIHSLPMVQTAFRLVGDNGWLSDHVFWRDVPLTSLGQLRVGTVWRRESRDDGRNERDACTRRIEFPARTFKVDFDPDGWRFVRAGALIEELRDLPFGANLYPDQRGARDSALLEFPIRSKRGPGRLIVHCLEFFSRMYGRSQELKRILATYPWLGPYGVARRLDATPWFPEPEDRWPVTLGPRLFPGDAVLVAHAKYDPVTRLAARNVYNQMEASHDPRDDAATHVWIGPWFGGAASMRASGIPFDDGRSFLGLHVVGASEPAGRDVVRHVSAGGEEGEETSPPDGGRGSPRRRRDDPEEEDLVDDEESDLGAGSVVVHDPIFQSLPPKRHVVTEAGDRSGNAARAGGVDAAIRRGLSGADPSGSGKGIDHAAAGAPEIDEADSSLDGVMRETWEAARGLMRDEPGFVRSVQSYRGNGRYGDDPKPALLYVPRWKRRKGWPWIDAKADERRAYLLIRLELVQSGIGTRIVHLLELQRRPRLTPTSRGDDPKGEAYRGVVIEFRQSVDPVSRLGDFMAAVVKDRGIVKESIKAKGLADRCEHLTSFRRSPASGNLGRSRATLDQALRKVGFERPRSHEVRESIDVAHADTTEMPMPDR